MSVQRIFLGVGEKGKLRDIVVNLVVEENNRDDVKEVLNDAVDLIYNGDYEDDGEDE